MRGEEKPWIVVSTGVDTSALYVSGRKSKLLWMRSNSPARSNSAEMWRHSDTFGSASGSSSQPRGTTEDRRAAVRESPDAKSVTSTPRCDETLGEQRRELLPGPVVAGRYSPRDGGQHGDAKTHGDASRSSAAVRRGARLALDRSPRRRTWDRGTISSRAW